MLSRIADRLMRARDRQMVGREAELRLFQSALDAEELPFLLLHLSGPNGVGKTTLLRAFQAQSQSRNLPTIFLDSRNFEATPNGLLNALRAALNLAPNEDPSEHLARTAGRRVLLIDTFEEFESQEDWVRDEFLPQLPDDTLVVVASSHPLGTSWRTDAGWQSILRTVALRNLTADESMEYLRLRGVPVSQHAAALDFTHGYPLALSLVADMASQAGPDAPFPDFTPENAPHIIQALLDKFLDKVPTPEHRAVLEIAALVRVTTEPLLTEMLEGMATGNGEGRESAAGLAQELFGWLRSLSFMESGTFGLYPHETAREALLADLRWRNRARYTELHHRARVYYSSRLEATSSRKGSLSDGLEQQRILFDYIFLHRDNPLVRSSFDWRDGQSVRVDTLQPGDIPRLVEIVRRFEGEESADLAAYWLEKQPENVIVLRERAARVGDEPAGFLFPLALHRTTDAERERDPACVAAWKYLAANNPLRPGEAATHFRFWMARETYHGVSPIQSQIIVQVVRHYLTTRNLAHTFFPVVSPERWLPMFDYAEIARIPEAEYMIGGRHYGVFGNDWRRLPPTAWLSLLADKETGAGEARPARRPDAPQLVVLSENDFGVAVRDALRHLNEPDILKNNPLNRSRLVVNASGSGGLRTLIIEAANALQTMPKLSRCYKPLLYTYIQPAPSQERAAEILDLPFSTYRRHLTEGIAEVTRLLWQKEIGEAGA